MKMTKDQLIEKVAGKVDLSRSKVEEVLNETLDTISNVLVDGGEVRLTGFGTFKTMKRSARKGVNPQNPSEKIDVPEVTVPKFRAGKTLKDAVK